MVNKNNFWYKQPKIQKINNYVFGYYSVLLLFRRLIKCYCLSIRCYNVDRKNGKNFCFSFAFFQLFIFIFEYLHECSWSCIQMTKFRCITNRFEWDNINIFCICIIIIIIRGYIMFEWLYQVVSASPFNDCSRHKMINGSMEKLSVKQENPNSCEILLLND